MNELRMYVEQLFKGRVLTDENIELKEEIYGNLVARYEDYISGGMDEAEALERTKASFTSIDDVFRQDQDLQGEQGEQAAATQVAAVQATVGSPNAQPTQPFQPMQPAQVPAERKRKLGTHAIIGISAAVVVIVAICAVLAFGALDRPQSQDQVADSQQSSETDSQSGSGSASTNSGFGSGSVPAWADPEDVAEYQATSALQEEVYAHTAAALQPYANISVSDSSSLDALAKSLPLGSYASTTVDSAVGSMTVDYANVDHNIDDDAIDRVLAYNSVAILAACPSMQSITFTVTEAHDDPFDADVYVYSRQMIEQLMASSGTGDSQITSDMFASEESWEAVRDAVLMPIFFDTASEMAERN